MEWFRIKTSTLLMRVAVDEIVYVKADGNYCDLVLINGRCRKMTFQLHHFEDNFKLLKSADMFIRVGRSLIVNRQYVQVIDLIDQTITFGGKHLTRQLRTDNPYAHRPDRNEKVSTGRDIYYFNIGVPVSTTPRENIRKLQTETVKESAEVVLSSDSILGVALDFYAIHGLRASIEFQEPDTADTSVFLYCRSADHQADGQYLGSLVVDGEERQSDCSRLGYMGMVGNQMVIGISRSDKVKDYCEENGGSFFRQFILVSNGVIPHRFFLHGKVERRAIGRKDSTLYYIATRHKETLWDFADALREYGFIDAIYITGGDGYCYYRTSEGERRDIGNIADYPHEKWKGIIPWLVFRRI